MKHSKSLVIAQELVERLRPACVRIEIAGSVRRGNKLEVKDIEIVAIPDLTPIPAPRPEFGKPYPKHYPKTMIEQMVAEMHTSGEVVLKMGKDKYKKLWLVEPGVQLDLFLVTPPAKWGVQFLIRTGPAEFSHWVVTRKSHGGALPNGYRVEDGAVWEGDTSNPTQNVVGFEEEAEFLDWLGLGWIEPGQREARWKR